MKNLHVFSTEAVEGIDNGDVNSEIGLAHHWGRTFNDTLLKICYQRKKLLGPKNDDFNTIEDFLIRHELPKRFRFMACIEATERSIDLSTTNHQALYDLDLEDDLLRPYATQMQIKELHKLYDEYLERIIEQGQDFVRNYTYTGVNKACREIISLESLRLIHDCKG